MSLIKRLKRITSARIDAFLESIENPKAIYPQLLKELEEHADAARKAQEKARSAVLSAQRKLDEVNGRILRYERGAKLALGKNDEETSRASVNAQIEAEQDAENLRKEMTRAEDAYEDARRVGEQLNGELTRLRERRNEILDRAELVETRDEVNALIESSKISENLLDQIGRLAVKVKTFAKELEQEALEPEDLEARLRQLDREAEIDSRMEQLREEKTD